MKNIVRNQYGEIRPWVSIAAVIAATLGLGTAVSVAAVMIALLSGATEQILTQSIAEINMPLFVVMYAVQIVAVALCFWLFYRRHWREMGLTAKGALSRLIFGLAFGALSIAAVAGLLLVSGQASVVDADPARIGAPAFWSGLVQFILVGFYEELLTRGYMMTALKTSRSQYIILLVPAVIFALLHIANPNVTFFSLVNIMLVGLVFAYLFVKTGSLWAPIGYHIAWNFVQGNVLGIAVSGGAYSGVVNIAFTGADWFTGGEFGAEGGAACTILLAACLVFIRFCVKKPEGGGIWTLDSGLPMPLCPAASNPLHPGDFSGAAGS